MVVTVESSLSSHFSSSSVLSLTTRRTQKDASSSARYSTTSGISVSHLRSGSAIAGRISLQSAGSLAVGKGSCGFLRLGHDGDVNPSRLAISPWLQGSVRARPLNAAIAETAEEGLKWWERGGAPNMHDISSTRDFVDELSSAGDKLVIVEFFATWCGSCRALYPKLCKLAAQNDQIRILKVNLDENKRMCKALGVKVLPFFHFYRAVGRVDSFSCSLSKLEKLKDAIAKHLDGAIGDGACQDSIGNIFASLQPLLDPADKPAAAAGSSE